MQEAVVFKAAATEKCMKRVQTLLSLNRFGKGAVYAGRAERRQLHRAGRLQEILIPARERKKTVTLLLAIAANKIANLKLYERVIFRASGRHELYMKTWGPFLA